MSHLIGRLRLSVFLPSPVAMLWTCLEARLWLGPRSALIPEPRPEQMDLLNLRHRVMKNTTNNTLYYLLECAVPKKNRAIGECDTRGEVLSGVDDVHGPGEKVETRAGPGCPLPVQDDAHPHTHSCISVSTLCCDKISFEVVHKCTYYNYPYLVQIHIRPDQN